METTQNAEPALTPAHLPQPRGDARWRWSTPRKAAAAGGAMAVVLGLGAGVAGAATSATSSTNAPRGQPAGQRPAVSGKITAIKGDDVTVRTQSSGTTTVVYSTETTFETMGAKGSRTTVTAAKLKVGEFIGVTGTKSSTGAVSATTIMIGNEPPGRAGPPGSGSRRPGAGPGPGG